MEGALCKNTPRATGQNGLGNEGFWDWFFVTKHGTTNINQVFLSGVGFDTYFFSTGILVEVMRYHEDIQVKSLVQPHIM